MFWYIVLGGSAVAAILAYTRGHNPLIWALTSVVGVPLLPLVPSAKGRTIAERNRARREVGNKVGLVTGVGVALLVILLAIFGVP